MFYIFVTVVLFLKICQNLQKLKESKCFFTNYLETAGGTHCVFSFCIGEDEGRENYNKDALHICLYFFASWWSTNCRLAFTLPFFKYLYNNIYLYLPLFIIAGQPIAQYMYTFQSSLIDSINDDALSSDIPVPPTFTTTACGLVYLCYIYLILFISFLLLFILL